MNSEKDKANISQFFKAVMSLESEEECALFFEDVATIKELLDISSRLEVARLLHEKKVFSEISATTGASSATISRVNKCLSYGSGGYEMILNRIKEK